MLFKILSLRYLHYHRERICFWGVIELAERRMFAKTIIDSDAFIDMPLSTQALYFHLSMRADDDGFINNPKKIQRMIGASDDDLKMLVAKRFIIPFESGIVVIKHWRIHNYIRGDRKKDTVYPEEMSMLVEKENGAYSLKSEEPIPVGYLDNETLRQKAYRESSLPYSFDYKIRHAFYGKECPVCGCAMKSNVDECGIATDTHKPSVQHNLPISKGGKHELGNISVICHQCNITLKDTETGRLNADEVIKKWDEICCADKCPSVDRQVTDKCQHRLGKDRLVEVSIGKDSINKGASPFDDFPDEVQDAIKSFMSMRKKQKKPMTENAINRLVKKLKDLSSDPQEQIKILNQSEDACWLDIYPLKTDKQKQRTNDGDNIFLQIAKDEGMI